MDRNINRLSVFLFFTDILWVCISLYVASLLRIYIPIGAPLIRDFTDLPVIVYLLAVLCWTFSLITSGAYTPQKVLRAVHELSRVLTASVMATVFFAGLLYLSVREVSRIQFVYFYFVTIILLLGFRVVLRVYYRIFGKIRKSEPNRIIILGAGELGIRVAKLLLDRSRWGQDFIGFLDDDPQKQGLQPDGLEGKAVLGIIDQVHIIVKEHQINCVYIALPSRNYKRLETIILKLQTEPVDIHVVPDYFSLALINARPDVIGGVPIITLKAPVIVGMDLIIKRIFDILVCSILLLFLWPIFLLIAIIIKINSPGPAIYKQDRVGENGAIFTMYKFRTMINNADLYQSEVNQYDEDGNIIHKRPDDPRITKLGRFLRKTSLDELPQIINVLKGEMSLVGPRPELPWLVDKYEPWQRKRFTVPQGITGWWQVNKREKELMHLSTKDDLYYVYNYSLFLDIRILFMTFGALFRGY